MYTLWDNVREIKVVASHLKSLLPRELHKIRLERFIQKSRECLICSSISGKLNLQPNAVSYWVINGLFIYRESNGLLFSRYAPLHQIVPARREEREEARRRDGAAFAQVRRHSQLQWWVVIASQILITKRNSTSNSIVLCLCAGFLTSV